MQDEVNQGQVESQQAVVTEVTVFDPAQLRVRHAQINAKRHRKLPWVKVAKHIGVNDTMLVKALNYESTPRREEILRKIDRLFTRIEKEQA